MNKILTVQEGIEAAKKLKKQNKKIVVVGGIFDILHPGHIQFLDKSKKYGDELFVLLEDDKNAAKQKGHQRPINSQINRAEILSSLRSVDYVILLENMTNNNAYDRIMVEIRPNIIATTHGDPHVDHKERQAKLTGAKVVYSIERIEEHSTTKYIKLLNK